MSGAYPSTKAPEDLFKASMRQAAEIKSLREWAEDHDQREDAHMEKMEKAVTDLATANVNLARTVETTIAWAKGAGAALGVLNMILVVIEVVRALSHAAGK